MKKINAFTAVNYKDISIITENMYNLYKSGIPIFNSFELIQDLPINKDYKKSINDIRMDLKSGDEIYKAFSKHENLYPKFFLSMLKIGEDTGRMEDVLFGINQYYKKIIYINKKITGFLTYPIILIFALIILSFFLTFIVLPTFQEVFEAIGKEAPKGLLFIINLKNAAERSPVSAIMGFILWLIVIPAVVIWYEKKNIMRLINKIPIFKDFKEYVSIVFLSIIMKSGISLAKGLNYCADVNLLGGIDKEFSIIRMNISQGMSLTSSMEDTMMFTKYTLAHIRIGEECGNLENILKSLEEELFDKVTMEAERIMELITPISIIFIGAIIMTFILVFMLPIFEGLIG